MSSPIPLGPELREASGVAVSLRHPGLFWINPDAGDLLYAADASGAVVGRVRLPLRLRDWEDLALSGCPNAGSCLYAADLGDNYEERHDLKIVRFPEPDPTDTVVGEAAVYPVALPDGPRDIEALLVFPGARLLAVTKGRNHPITVYRYPGALPDTPPGEPVVLEEVQRLSEAPRILPRQVTGGAVDPRGAYAVLRTYQSLYFYRLDADTLAALPGGAANLRTLHEPQGEGVGLGMDGEVVLTSEGGPGGGPGALTVIRCTAKIP